MCILQAQHAVSLTLHSLVADVDLQTFIFTDFGKNVPKQLKLSPDGFIQNAIQLAYYK